ncbi:hypothetical protein BZB76_1144 [Actinomadura pelletieri DSM 43383]|uniref:Uncharacterized protein n=1 Tax=Actinomadura pelletieri DSM 43383 TaxID=1120940 RepID=A0A495QZL7_9ACTN|nr:hypothetical protein BZB76_1144 [Actinomadura pelletieri DSM 43383]
MSLRRVFTIAALLTVVALVVRLKASRGADDGSAGEA